jgi:hypothetical protein
VLGSRVVQRVRSTLSLTRPAGRGPAGWRATRTSRSHRPGTTGPTARTGSRLTRGTTPGHGAPGPGPRGLGLKWSRNFPRNRSARHPRRAEATRSPPTVGRLRPPRGGWRGARSMTARRAGSACRVRRPGGSPWSIVPAHSRTVGSGFVRRSTDPRRGPARFAGPRTGAWAAAPALSVVRPGAVGRRAARGRHSRLTPMWRTRPGPLRDAGRPSV